LSPTTYKTPVTSPRNTDPARADAELNTHVPLLIRWGVACLMVIATLVALAAKGEGEVSVVSAAAFFILWIICLWKSGQSAFAVVAALIDKQKNSEPDGDR
jgi:uncharacterized membrane protein